MEQTPPLFTADAPPLVVEQIAHAHSSRVGHVQKHTRRRAGASDHAALELDALESFQKLPRRRF